MFVSKYPVTKDGIDYLVEISKCNNTSSIIAFSLGVEYEVDIFKKQEKKIFIWNKATYEKVHCEYYDNDDICDIKNRNDFLLALTNKTFVAYNKKIKQELDKSNQELETRKTEEIQEKVFEEWNGIIENKTK